MTIPLSKPFLSSRELSAVARVLRSRHLAAHHEVSKFEEEFAAFVGARHGVATSSGTAALYVATRCLDLLSSDEVIVPAFSFLASSDVVLLSGATPVFADIDQKTFTVDPVDIDRKITKRTKAVVVVHLYGHPADMERIEQIARVRKVTVIEDCAQAHGAKVGHRLVGSFGIGCFSFYATKNMTTGEGGMIVTSDRAIADRARLLRCHGYKKSYQQEFLSLNFMMNEMEAAIGRVQLRKLDRMNRLRREIAAFYDTHITNPLIEKPVEKKGYTHAYHQYTLRVKNGRDRFREYLQSQHVETNVYYPLTLPDQLVYQKLGYKSKTFPESQRAAYEVLSIPIHPGLTNQERRYVVNAINNYA